MIDEMIEELKQVKQILEELQEQYNYAVEQVEIYDEALEKMAISYFGTNSCIRFNDIQVNDARELYDYFRKQAKEELKNE